MSQLLERFLRYVKIDTQSDPNGSNTPSTAKQFDLAKVLVQELKDLGVNQVELDDNCIVYAKIDKTKNGLDAIGFLAHLDTSPDASGANVSPQIIQAYDGTPIVLNKQKKIIMDPKDFPSLKRHIGHTLITTDGTTLLGADDKAGVAEIMTMVATVLETKVPHGDIYIAFTPDEEIGGGIETFDLSKFHAAYAYTVDGGEIEEFSYECFNAASAKVEIQGIEVHPGSAKNKMIHASEVAFEFLGLLPKNEKPFFTDHYDGFHHLTEMRGDCASAELCFIIRNHDLTILERQKNDFLRAATFLNEKYKKELVTITLKDAYRNMFELIKKDMRSVDRALSAMRKIGLTPLVSPIRGGTDGAYLTRIGLNTPNLGTGGYNYHGKFEYASLQEMEQAVQLLLAIVTA